MKTSGIDGGRIEGMLQQMKMAASRPQGVDAAQAVSNPLQPARAGNAEAGGGFARALKASLDQVNASQGRAELLGKRFAMGDESVNLSDAMIAAQKASISFQATVQVRNKLVSAYQEMLNMQV